MEYEWEGKEVGESGIYEEEEEELAVAKTRCQVTRFPTRRKNKNLSFCETFSFGECFSAQ